MNIYYEFSETTFVRNEEKARKNVVKHKGITFEKAAESFFDPFVVFVDATRNYEQRDGIISRTLKGQLLFVVRIWIDDERIRIISARKATKNQQRQYYENQRP